MSTKTDKRYREMTRTRAGKGSALRPMDVGRYNDNWDRIFGNAKNREKNSEDLPEDSQGFGQEKI